ncbi:MAG: alpha/beta hydrolase [Planctomycetia bacterium]
MNIISIYVLLSAVWMSQVSKPGTILENLEKSLNEPTLDLKKLSEQPFTSEPMDSKTANLAKEMIIKAYKKQIQNDRRKELSEKVFRDGRLEMPYDFQIYGEKPSTGRSLWISLHGGGGAPKQVNDQQWQNQKKLYKPEEGIYLAPRAPTNTWNLWHEPHIDRLFNKLVESLIATQDVNPDKVYILGYSAGGDGVYQMAPRMADYWAAAAMMAGHPNGVSLLSLRNVPFALQVGANDSAYNRNKIATEYGEALQKLQKNDPGGYENLVKIHEGKGHWMNLEDKIALPWMSKYSRNPIPQKVVWKQTGVPHYRSYWLAIPIMDTPNDSLIIAEYKGQTVEISRAEKIKTVLVRFSDKMMDLDKTITITHQGQKVFEGKVNRLIKTQIQTLQGRGDPLLVFDAEVSVTIPSKQ